ncbi:YecR family lipoprotein [Pseudocitrobacter cyperus]|uniref:YecR family lipoprotein n=1 Tax=Pseudocitrobacter cyperus TaxID=3112843 RepID=A0ABV0HCK2_9ENTR
MKPLLLISAITLMLTGCNVTRQASVSEMDATSGIVRLTYGQAMLQNARTDDYVVNGTATKACQQMGYATAFAFGQPITTCTTSSGPLCINESVTLQFQCRGIAVTSPTAALN